jgi:hypothetical protein
LDVTKCWTAGFVLTIALIGTTVDARAQYTDTGRRRAAAWMSVGHPGLGEWYNAGWGGFFDNCPQKKFWLGFIPLYGWPGYLQVLSAIDAYHGRTSDNLVPIE